MTFPSPLGVAAGMDKGATWFEGLGALGFGFVEVGTITAEAQPGNPKPRVWRLVEERGLVNAMGFPNPGADKAARRLRRRGGEGIVAVNVGKSKSTPLEDAAADYRASVRALARARGLRRGQRELAEHGRAARPPGRRPVAHDPGRDRR